MFITTSLFGLSSTSVNAQWEPCNNGLTVDNINSIVVNGNDLIASVKWEGIFISTDRGDSWVKSNVSNIGSDITKLFIKDNLIFACTQEGIYYSTDNGVTWIEQDIGIPSTIVSSLVSLGDFLFCGTMAYGVYFSDDNGESWMNVGMDGYNINALASKENTLFAGTFNGLFKTTNLGATWNKIDAGFINTNIRSIAISQDKIFVGTLDGIFLSTDDGVNWIEKSNGLTDKHIRDILIFQNHLVVATWEGVFLSYDWGEYFNEKNSGLTNTNTGCLVTDNYNIYAGTLGNGGIFRASLAPFLEINVEENSNQNNEISIFPNPVSDILSLNLNQTVISNSIIRIYNVQGNIVLESEIPDGIIEWKLITKNLPVGLYYLNLLSENECKAQRFVILR